MRKSIILIALIVVQASFVYAGAAENIQACVKKANDFAGVNLNEFDAAYNGNIFAMSIAKWPNALCEVKLGDVYNLTVNGKEYIVDGYAGRKSLSLKNKLEEKTNNAISKLKSRIALLEERFDQVKEDLKKANPNHASLESYIDEGIEQSLGVSHANMPHAVQSPNSSQGQRATPSVYY